MFMQKVFTQSTYVSVFATCMLVLGTLLPQVAQGQLTLTPSASPTSVACGGIFTVSVAVTSGFTDLTAIDFGVCWDETKVRYVLSSALNNPGGETPGLNTTATSSGEFGYSLSATTVLNLTNGIDVADGTTILTLTFRSITSTVGTDAISVCTNTVTTLTYADFDANEFSITPGTSATINLTGVGCTTGATAGSVILDSQADVDAFLSGGCKYTSVNGSLTIVGNAGADPITDLCNLVALTSITGALAIRDFNVPSNPTSLADLANLGSIGTNLTIGGAVGDLNSSFTSVSLPGLTTVGGTISITHNTAATSISLAALSSSSVTSVSIQTNAAATSIVCGNGFMVDGGAVNISNNAALQTLTLNAASVSGAVTLSNNDGAGLAVSGSLGAVGTSLAIQNCAGLASVSFPNLTSIGGTIDATNGNLTITDNATAVTSISLPVLLTIDGIIDMSNAVADLCTPTLDFSDLTEVDGSINITRSAGGAVSFPDLTTVRGSITFGTNFNGVAGMTSLSMAALTHNDVGAVDITENDVMTSLTFGNTFSTGANDDITIDNNDVLSTIVLNGTTAGGVVTISNNDGAASTINSSLGEIGEGLNIQNSSGLTSISFPSLTKIGGDPDNTPAGSLTISGNGAGLASISMPLLETIDGSLLMVNNNGTLPKVSPTLNFNALERVDVSIDVSYAAGGAVTFPNLTTVETNITFDFNDLTSLSLGALNSASVGAVTISDNDAMTSLTLGNGFTSDATNDISITNNDIATSIVLNAASARNVTISNNDGTNLAISGSLGTVREDLAIQNAASLASVSFPNLASIGGFPFDATAGNLTISANGTVLNSVSMPLLQTIDGAITMNNVVANDVSATAALSFAALTDVDAAVNFTRAAASISAPLLTTIAGSLTISTNSALTTLAGLGSITTIGTTAANESMVVQNNPLLAACCIIPCQLTSIDGNVTPFTGDLTMSGNSATCNSYAAAATACSVSMLDFDVTEMSGTGNNDNEICDGATVTLEASVTATVGTVTFDFFIDVNTSGLYEDGTDILIASIDDNTSPYAASTTYSSFTDGQVVMVKASNSGDGCSAYSGTLPPTITVNANPVVNSVDVSAVAPCTGSTVDLEADVTGGTPGYTYAWSVTGGAGSGTFDPLAANVNPIGFDGVTAGDVTVQVIATDTKNCMATETKTFDVYGASCIGGTFVGNVTLDGQAEVDAFLTSAVPGPAGCKYTSITGNLILVGNDGDGDPITNLCNLNELVSVTGSVTIRDFNHPLNPINLDDLAKLQTVGDAAGTDNLTIGGAAGDQNTSFAEIELLGLQSVSGATGSLIISFNPNAATVNLPALQSVKTDLNINNNPGLTTITATNNFTVGQNLLIQNNDAANLTAITLNATSVTLNLTLDNDDSNAGTTISLPALTTVTGTLTITDIAGDVLDLDVLQTIGGAATISSNNGLTDIEFEQLTNTAAVTINGNAILETIDEDDAGGPITATGTFTVSSNPTLTSVVVNDLANVTGSVDITANVGLQTIDLPGLATVSVDVTIDGAQSALTGITLGNGATVITRDLLIQANDAPGLATINANVASVGRNLTLDNDNTGASGTTISLPNLTAVGNVTAPGNLTITDIATGTLGLPLLNTVSGTLSIGNNDNGLTTINMGDLSSVGDFVSITGDLSIVGNEDLVTINTVGNATIGRDILVTGNHSVAASSLATVNLNGINKTGRDITLDNNNLVPTGAGVTFFNLTSVGRNLTITQIANAVGSSSFTVTGDVNITDNNALCFLSPFGLTSVGGFLEITDNFDNCGGPIIDLASLTTVGEHIEISGNDYMPSLTFTALTTVSGQNGTGLSIDITNNDIQMTTLSFPALSTATTGEFRVSGNANLASISAPMLLGVGEDLRLEDNNLVNTLTFTALASVGGLINIDDEDAIVDLNGFPALATVKDLTINSNNALATISNMPLLTAMTGNLNITNNALLNGLSGLANLVTVGGNMAFTNNDATTTLDGANGFNSLDVVTGTFSATGNALLANCCVVPCRVEDPTMPGFTDGGGAITVNTNNGPGACTTLAEAKTACTPTSNITSPSATPNNVCLNGSIVLDGNPTGGNAPYTHTWAITGGTGTATIADATANPATFTGTATGTVNVSYLVESADGCSAILSTYTFTVDAPPTLTVCPSNQTNTTAPDVCEKQVTWTHPNVIGLSASCGPATLTVDYGTGDGPMIITPATSSFHTFPEGTSTVTYQLKDGNNNVVVGAGCTFTVTINDEEDPEILTCPVARNIVGCTTDDITGPIYDEDVTASSYAEFSGVPNGGTAADNCTFTVSYHDAALGTCPVVVTRTWIITDVGNNSVECQQTITILHTAPPVVPADGASPVTCYTLATLPTPPVVTDACGTPIIPVLNSTVDSPDPVVCSGTRTYNYTYTDCANLSTPWKFVYTINDNVAPTVNCPAALTLECAAANNPTLISDWLAAVTGNDACGTVTIEDNYNVSNFSDGCGATGAQTVTFTAEDACGNFNTVPCTQTITISDNTAPTVNCPSPLTLECADANNATLISDWLDAVTGNDACGTATITNNYNIANFSDLCGATGVQTVTFTATDACSNTNTVPCTQTITISDNTAPTVNCPAALTLECANANNPTLISDWLNAVTGNDACGTVTIEDNYNIANFSDGCGATGAQTVTFTAEDACGNFNTVPCTQTITISDNLPPTGTTPSGATDVNACQSTTGIEVLHPKATDETNLELAYTDACGTVTATFVSESFTGGSTQCAWTLNRIYTISDGCAANNFNVTITYSGGDKVPPTPTCEAAQTINLNGSCGLSVPNLTDGATATDNCSGATYTWSQSVTTGTILPSADGMTHTITVTVRDCANNSATCTVVLTGNDATPPTVSCPGNQAFTSVACAPTHPFTIPDAVTDNCIGATWNATFSTNPGAPTNLTGLADGSNSGPVNFPGGVTTVTLSAVDAGGNSSTSNCSFTVTVTVQVCASGNIVRWGVSTPDGVGNAIVDVTGSATATTSTNSLGDYGFPPLTAGSITIKPVKNINALNGITAADASRIQQHVMGLLPITNPYQMLAADVFPSNSITNQDANTIMLALANNPIEIARILSNSWRFVPQSYTLPTPPWSVLPIPNSITITQPGTFTGQNFYGVKTGDLVATFANPLLKPSEAPPALVWTAQDRLLDAGQEVEVELNASQFTDFLSFQFALGFDPGRLAYLGHTGSGLLPDQIFGEYEVGNGELRTLWAAVSSRTMKDGDLRFRLRFRALVDDLRLSDELRIDATNLENEAYNSQFEVANVELRFAELSTATANVKKDRLRLLQNKPNPFHNETVIGFYLPESCEAQLRIFDASGRMVTEHKAYYPAGYQEETLRLDGVSVSGLYYYELTTPVGTLTRKMVRQE